MTSKRLRHLQMQENVVGELQQQRFCDIQHINGNISLSDLFTKEDRDKAHFCLIRDMIMSPKPETFTHKFNAKRTSTLESTDRCSIHNIIVYIFFISHSLSVIREHCGSEGVIGAHTLRSPGPPCA